MSCQHLDGFAGKSRMCLLGVSSCSLPGEVWGWWLLPDQACGLLEFVFICFPVTACFFLPDSELQPGSDPQPHHHPHKGLWFVRQWWGGRVWRELGRRCHLSPEGPSPELELEQGKQQSLTAAQGLNQWYPTQTKARWSPYTVRSVYSLGPYTSSHKSLIFQATVAQTTYIHFIGTAQVWAVYHCLNFSA